MRLIQAWMEDARRAPDLHYVEVCDGIRVLAIGIVAWFHIWQQSWLWPGFTLFGFTVNLDPFIRSGYIWVDIMILLSGFCHWLPWARLGRDAPNPSWRAFYRRRIARIVPSYFLSVAILFAGSMATGFYATSAQAAKDVAAHLTFTSVFFYDTYYATPLNAGLWTIAVEMHYYLLFPWIARAFRKMPATTSAVMIAAALSFRGWTAVHVPDVGIWFNQLIAYLDVFALGMLAAQVHAALSRRPRGAASRILADVLAVFSLWMLFSLSREQARCNGTEAIRLGQMQRRIWMGLFGALLVLGAANGGLLFRRLLGNPLTRFLSGISMQFYIWHQVLAVQILYLRLVPSIYDNPNWSGDTLWQTRFTLVCVLGALGVATLLTYAFERPIARRITGGREKTKV